MRQTCYTQQQQTAVAERRLLAGTQVLVAQALLRMAEGLAHAPLILTITLHVAVMLWLVGGMMAIIDVACVAPTAHLYWCRHAARHGECGYLFLTMWRCFFLVYTTPCAGVSTAHVLAQDVRLGCCAVRRSTTMHTACRDCGT
jgi:hypothetical protein